jgi:deoxyadenosine/deoxycytidine kinase
MFEEVDNEHTRLVYDNCYKEKVSFGFIDEFTQKKRKFMKQLQCYFIEEYNINKAENNSNSNNTSNSSTTCDREVVTEMFFQYV